MIVYAAVFLMVMVAVLLGVWALRPLQRTHKVQMALERLDNSPGGRAYRQLELEEPVQERLLAPALVRLGALGRLITPVGRVKRLQDKVEQAGRPWNLDVNGLLAVKFMSLVVGLLIVVLLASRQILSALPFVLIAIAIVLVTYYLPDLMLRRWIGERKKRISRALPDFLDLLTVTIEAGLGLDSALARIAEKLKDPLREEILITLHHMRIGQSRDVALREFALRCGVKDLDDFVSTLIQSQRLGVSMGKILRTQSATLRVVRTQRIEEAGQKAPIKMLFPLVLLIFPALFVVILGPAAIRFYEVVVR